MTNALWKEIFIYLNFYWFEKTLKTLVGVQLYPLWSLGCSKKNGWSAFFFFPAGNEISFFLNIFQKQFFSILYFFIQSSAVVFYLLYVFKDWSVRLFNTFALRKWYSGYSFVKKSYSFFWKNALNFDQTHCTLRVVV